MGHRLGILVRNTEKKGKNRGARIYTGSNEAFDSYGGGGGGGFIGGPMKHLIHRGENRVLSSKEDPGRKIFEGCHE